MIDLDDFTSPDNAIHELRRDSGADSQIVVGILDDLTGRKGFDHQWDAVDEGIQLEIIRDWLDIVRAAFGRGGVTEGEAAK